MPSHPSRTRTAGIALAAALFAACGGGCVFYDDLASTYDLIEDTEAVLIAHAEDFQNPDLPYDRIPPGRAHWIAGPKKVLALLESMRFEPVSEPPDDHSAVFALVFLPSDPNSRIIFYLDKNLNLLPGFRQHGVDYGGKFYRTSDEFKIIVLGLIESCPHCRERLPALRREWPEDGAGR